MLIVLLLLQTCFCFVIRETSYCFFLTTDVIEAFNSTSRYLDGLRYSDNLWFKQIIGQIYSTEHQLNKPNSFDTEVPVLNMAASLTNGILL